MAYGIIWRVRFSVSLHALVACFHALPWTLKVFEDMRVGDNSSVVLNRVNGAAAVGMCRKPTAFEDELSNGIYMLCDGSCL